MPGKELVIAKIKKAGLVAIVRSEERMQVPKIVAACLAGGVTVIELSFTMPGTLELLQELSAGYQSGEILLGAGTILDPETARAAILAGAQYIITPYLNPETVRLCNRYQVACIPGAMTIKEVAECLEAGAELVKIFPAELFGPPIIKAIKGPLPQAELIPTGGVSVNNLGEWFQAGAVAVGVGSGLIAAAKQGDYEAVTGMARQFMSKIRKIKNYE